MEVEEQLSFLQIKVSLPSDNGVLSHILNLEVATRSVL